MDSGGHDCGRHHLYCERRTMAISSLAVQAEAGEARGEVMMQKFLILLLLLSCVFALPMTADSDEQKLWVSLQYQYRGDRVLLIEDKETGTRCYAITNSIGFG